MTITTKFNIGEMVYFLDKNQKTQYKPVYRIDTETKIDSTTVKYWLDQNNLDGYASDMMIVDSSRVFATKEELIESIVG